MADRDRYDVLREAHRVETGRQFKETARETTDRQPPVAPEQPSQAKQQDASHWIDAEEKARTAHTEKIQSRLEAGKIDKHQAYYEMQRQENDLSGTYNKSQTTERQAATVQRSAPASERADMVSQQIAETKRFRQNSQDMQKQAGGKRETPAQEQPASGQRELTFAKDRERGKTAEVKQEPGKQQDGVGDRKLTFAKDGAGKTPEKETQDNSIKGQAKAAGKELTFRKDQGHDISRGR